MPESSAFPQARTTDQGAGGAVDPAGPRALLERVVERDRPRLAAADPAVLDSMRELASLRARSGELSGARELLEEAGPVLQRLGASDPRAVLLAFDLAVVAQAQGDHTAARAGFGRVATFGPAALGPGDPAVVQARAYLAAGSPAVLPADLPWPSTGMPRLWPAPAPLPPAHGPDAEVPTPGWTVPPQSPAPPIPGAPATGSPTTGSPATGSSARRRFPVRLLVAVAVLVVVAAVVAVVLVRPGETTPTARTGPAAPTDVRLHDAGESVLVQWDAPAADGLSSFTVVEALDADSPLVERTVDPRERSYEATGLDPNVEYCFAVAATFGRTRTPLSPPACTRRGVRGSRVAASPAPGAAPTASSATASPTPTPRPSRSRAAGNTPAPASASTTRIVSPSNGTRVSWPFTARFTVSEVDARASSTVVALLLCIAGRCYLDGKLDISGGSVAPYAVRLGSTRPEAIGATWTVRLDRLPATTYARLVSERNAAIANSTWGDKGTTLSALNATPVATLTVVKG